MRKGSNCLEASWDSVIFGSGQETRKYPGSFGVFVDDTCHGRGGAVALVCHQLRRTHQKI
jgi:hypothetical protein